MKSITTGWTTTRVAFLVLGGLIVAQAFWDKQWIGLVFGSYFAAMGLFAFGCASGNCYSDRCDSRSQQKENSDVISG